MKVVVIGAGVIGLASAYALRQSGHDVLVVDRQRGPGLETSYATGSLLTPSMADPWNSPGCWRDLRRSLMGRDSPLRLKFGALPSLVCWGMRFLKHAEPRSFARAALSNIRLALYSKAAMGLLRQREPLEYDSAAHGSLRVFRNMDSLEQATAVAERRLSESLAFHRLSRKDVVALEPALEAISAELAGGLHYSADEVGDTYRFCVALTEAARRMGVAFRFGTSVLAIEHGRNEVRGARIADGRIQGDAFVVAAGSYSVPLVRSTGVSIPVRPAKGYSMTILEQELGTRLSIPIVDDDWHVAVVPIGGSVRVAGTAEFGGYDLSIKPDRITTLLRVLKRVLPQTTVSRDGVTPWCGLRPMSADGVPIIGPTPFSNLFLNTGHGHLGWTMAMGSGHLLADLVSDRPPGVDPAPYAWSRFGGSRAW